MLVITRKPHEQLCFPGLETTIEVVSIKGNAVRLGIAAPAAVKVLRSELMTPSSVVPDSLLAAPDPIETMRSFRHALRNRLNAATVGLSLLRKRQELGQVQDPDGALDYIESEIRGLIGECDAAAAVTKANANPGPRPALKRALLVEDQKNERELLAGFLRLGGMIVETAEDGLAALDRLQSQYRPDVVLLDMGMPRCDGPTTAREIRRNPDLSGLKIYAVTGRERDEFGRDADTFGVDRWFSKPLDPQSLLREIEREFAA